MIIVPPGKNIARGKYSSDTGLPEVMESRSELSEEIGILDGQAGVNCYTEVTGVAADTLVATVLLAASFSAHCHTLCFAWTPLVDLHLLHT